MKICPCAECGGQAVLREAAKVGKAEPWIWWYECKHCGISPGAARTKEGALEAWNLEMSKWTRSPWTFR